MRWSYLDKKKRRASKRQKSGSGSSKTVMRVHESRLWTGPFQGQVRGSTDPKVCQHKWEREHCTFCSTAQCKACKIIWQCPSWSGLASNKYSAAPLGCATMAAAPSPPAEFWLCSVLRTRGAVQDALFECNCSWMAKIRTYISTACHGTTSGASAPATIPQSRRGCAKRSSSSELRNFAKSQNCARRVVMVACKPRQPRLTSLQPFSESSTTYSFTVHYNFTKCASELQPERI